MVPRRLQPLMAESEVRWVGRKAEGTWLPELGPCGFALLSKSQSRNWLSLDVASV